MKTIMKLTLKNAVRDPYLLFWSLFIPVAGTVGFGYFIGGMEYAQRILTGMICTSVFFYAYMTTVFTNIAQRRRGVYNLLKITPLSLGKYIVSISLAWAMITLICSCLVLLTGILIFKVSYPIGGILSMLFVIFIAAIGYIFLSFFISSFCKNEGHASMISNIITIPLLFCSDAFYPIQAAPKVIQHINKINPFQYFVDGVRAALNGDFNDYLLCSVILMGLLFVTLFIAIKTFKFSE